jgi:hypothetical protein
VGSGWLSGSICRRAYLPFQLHKWEPVSELTKVWPPNLRVFNLTAEVGGFSGRCAPKQISARQLSSLPAAHFPFSAASLVAFQIGRSHSSGCLQRVVMAGSCKPLGAGELFLLHWGWFGVVSLSGVPPLGGHERKAQFRLLLAHPFLCSFSIAFLELPLSLQSARLGIYS